MSLSKQKVNEILRQANLQVQAQKREATHTRLKYDEVCTMLRMLAPPAQEVALWQPPASL